MKRSRPRRSAQQTRELMVAEGLRQLQESGVGLGVDHLTLERAMLAAEIPRSSSHSAWSINDDYTPQVNYQRAVLKAWLLEREDTLFADAATTALAELFSDPAKPPTISEIVRTAIQAAFAAGLDDAEGVYISTDLALRHAITSPPPADRDEQVEGWLRAGETANRTARIEDSYKPLGELTGMGPKEAFGEAAYELFGIAVASLVEGISLRTRLLPELRLDEPLFPTPEGDAPTLLIGLCVEALVPMFFEPIADEG